LTALGFASAARADNFDQFFGLGTLGGLNSYAVAISGDGKVVIGYSNLAGGTQHPFSWSGGVMSDLGTLAGTGNAGAFGVSADGSVIVGSSLGAGGGTRAFRWSGGVMTDLGVVAGGLTSSASGVSADGSVVVGSSALVGGGGIAHAFRWSGGVMSDLGTLGGSSSQANSVSADGTVVVGWSNPTGSSTLQRAFRWSGGVMSDLGTLGGSEAVASGVSANGAVVVGYSNLTGDNNAHAFRWTGGVMADLGTLGGGDSVAQSVSADGNIVVGYSYFAGSAIAAAFRWKANTGMQSIQSLLTASGVNTTGWQLRTANGVSDDGSVIIGYGTNPSGNTEGWLVRCTVSCAFLNSGAAAQSFSGQSAMGQTGNAALGNTLGTMNEVATQTGASQGNTPFAAFGYGGYDSDPAASGTLGLTMRLPNEMVAGVMGSANYVRTKMVYDGNSKMQGGSGGAFIARAPNAGAQWLLGVSGIALKGDVTRGYLNGNTPTTSQGNTTGNGYGFTGRVGWAFDNVAPATQITPFASYSVTRMHFNGYTETGGPFPAQMNGFTDTTQIARFGADARYTFTAGKWIWGTLATAHKLNGSKTDNITGTIIGLFDVSAPGGSVAKDWIETTAGVRWPAWKNGAITASLTASIPANYATTYQARLGISQAF
jgi:probable HAF family extracellular repeat protein